MSEEAADPRPKTASRTKLVKPTSSGPDHKFTNKAGKRRAKPKGSAGRAGPGRLSRLPKAELIERLIDHEDAFWQAKAELKEFSERPFGRPAKSEGMIAYNREKSHQAKQALAALCKKWLVERGPDFKATCQDYADELTRILGRTVSRATLSRPEYKEILVKGYAGKAPKAPAYARSERARSLKQANRYELIWRILQLEKELVAVGERTQVARDDYARSLEPLPLG